jgi:hypothetical protein
LPIKTVRLLEKSPNNDYSLLIKGNIMRKLLITSLLTLVAHQALANDHATETQMPAGLYVGGGVSYNDLDFNSIDNDANNETATGIQVFAGIPITNTIRNIETFAEVGFFRTSSFDFGPRNKERVTGVSGSVVLQRDLNEVNPNLYALARVGLEIGDDDGVLMGFGAGYRITPKVEVRAEFANKDLISSYQLNALVRF